jgi:hypothetical protein
VTEYGTYTVTGEFPIQDSKTGEPVQTGGTVELKRYQGSALEDQGLVTSDSDAGKEPATYQCPACVADPDRKRAFRTASQDELAEHYADKHAAFAAPNLGELTRE